MDSFAGPFLDFVRVAGTSMECFSLVIKPFLHMSTATYSRMMQFKIVPADVASPSGVAHQPFKSNIYP